MTRPPSLYITIVRTVFGVIFVAGFAVHLRAAVSNTSSYGPFGDTAWPPLDWLWGAVVMPNIGWLALGMAAFELAIGVTAWLPGLWNRLSVIGMVCFFVFLLALGYAFPTTGWVEDLLVNRAGSLVMLALVAPWLLRPQEFSVPAVWSSVVRRAGHRQADA